MVKYSRTLETSKSCKAMGPDMHVHFKNTYETAKAIKGMPVLKAVKYLEDVVAHRRCVPFRRFTGCIGKTAQAKEFKHTQGRWPEKSCKVLIGLIKNAMANAEARGLNPDECVIWHIATNRAQKGRRRTYRAHGRINPHMSNPTHIEIILKEQTEAVEAPAKDSSHKVLRFTKKQNAHRRLRAVTVSA